MGMAAKAKRRKARCPECGAPLLLHLIENVMFCPHCDGREQLLEDAEMAEWAEYAPDTREEWAGAR